MKHELNNYIMKLPWYVKYFYDKDKECYIIKVNKYWAVWSLFKYYLFKRWISKNTYPYNWKVLTSDIEISTTPNYWTTANSKDWENITNAK